MDPLSLLFLGGTALSSIGGLLGRNASSKQAAMQQMMAMQMQQQGLQQAAAQSAEANAINREFNEKNFALRERERAEAMAFARELMGREDKEQQAGVIDASGNRLRFDPERGWITELSPADRFLRDEQIAEQLRTLRTDLPQRRRALAAQEQQQGQQRSIARRFADELGRVVPDDPTRLENLMVDQATRGQNEAAQGALSTALRTAMRTGNADVIKNITAEVSKGLGKSLGEARTDAAIRAPQISAENYRNRRNDLAQLYAAFADRGAPVPNVNYAPTATDVRSNPAIQGFAQESGVTGRAGLQTAGMRGGAYDYVQPDMGMANALVGSGQLAYTAAADQDQRTRSALAGFDNLASAFLSRLPKSTKGSVGVY